MPDGAPSSGTFAAKEGWRLEANNDLVWEGGLAEQTCSEVSPVASSGTYSQASVYGAALLNCRT